MRRILFVLTALAGLGLTAPVAAIEAQTVADRAVRAAYYTAEDGRAQVTMTITDSQGRERSRKLTILRRDEGEESWEQKFYVYFRRPPDVARTAFLVWKHRGTSDDRWLYLPALDLIKRIAASDERTSFVGSHFYYEDVSGRGSQEDTHKLLETTDTYYVLESRPKEPDTVKFDHTKSWIHKDTFLPVKIEWKDSKGETYRMYEALAVETRQGNPTVVKARMTDHDRGGNTVLEYRDVTYDIGLPADIFKERYLRNPPHGYLGD